jgi:hypothetical protein
MKKKTILIFGGLGGMVMLALLACLLPMVAMLALVEYPLRSNPGMEQGMKILKNDPEVIKVFGSPVQQGIIIMGQTRSNLYGSGNGNLWTPISGPKNKGEVTIYVQKPEDGDWFVKNMSIRINGKPVLDWNDSESASGFTPVSTPPPRQSPQPTLMIATRVPTP